MRKKISFSVKLGILLFCVIFLPVLIISMFTMSRLSVSISLSSQELNDSNLKSMAHSMEQYFKTYEDLTEKLLISDTIRKIAASATKNQYQQLLNDRAFASEIQKLLVNDFDMEYVYLLTATGSEYHYSYNPENLNIAAVREKYHDFFISPSTTYSSIIRYDEIFLEHAGHTQCKILISRPLINAQSGKYLGLIVLQLSPNVLSSLLGYTEDLTYVVGSQGQILYDSQNLHCGEQWEKAVGTSEDSRQTTYGETVYAPTEIELNSGWQLIQFKAYHHTAAKIYEAVTPLFAVSILCIVFFIIIAFVLSHWLTTPIQTLQNAMKNAEHGNLTQHVEIHTSDEFEELGSSYNHMLDQLNHFIQKAYDEELQHVNAEYRALQSQINPHFLYNALESVNSLAQIHHQSEISKMVCCLADMFRYTAKQTDHLVVLEQELQYVRNYVTLLGIPYESSMSVNYQIPDELLNFQMPKMILQPLVENCFNHATDNVEADAFTISIYAQKIPGGMILSVSDNGAGIPEDKLRELTERLNSTPSRGNDGPCVGLVNISHRIRLAYQPGSGMELYSRAGKGTTVLLKMYQTSMESE